MVIVWCIGFLQKRYGPLVLLILFIVLFLVGGGIAQVLFFLPVWAYSTRVNKPLRWWKTVFSREANRFLSAIWTYTLVISSLLFLAALEIAVVGYFPGITNPDTLLYTCWSFLAISWILMNLTFIAGFADDIAKQRA
jgi:ABC-type Na+ efflux pump permease subunit